MLLLIGAEVFGMASIQFAADLLEPSLYNNAVAEIYHVL